MADVCWWCGEAGATVERAAGMAERIHLHPSCELRYERDRDRQYHEDRDNEICAEQAERLRQSRRERLRGGREDE